MSGARSLAFAFCWLMVVATVVSGLGASSSGASPERPAVDNAVTHIQVHASGNATWSVVVRTRLETESEVERYRAFQDRFRNNTTRYLDTFRGRIRSVVRDAEGVTGREMRAADFSASTDVQEVPRRWGVITYRFRWTNFAAHANGSTLDVGDVFQGGYYLDEDDIFAVSAPDGYTLDSASPAPNEGDSGTARWFGPHDFGDERPHAVFRIDEADQTSNAVPEPNQTTDSTVGSEGTTAESPVDSDGRPLALLVGIGIAVFAVGTAAVWRIRSRADDLSRSSATGDSPAPSSSEGSASVKTDTERVRELLREHDGRSKQAEMADELGWSASKTSRVLSTLEDEGVVERVRLGRENVVDLSRQHEQ